MAEMGLHVTTVGLVRKCYRNRPMCLEAPPQCVVFF